MRNSNDWSKCVDFEGDLEDGRYRVVTPSGFILELEHDEWRKGPLFDPRTGEEIFYPNGANW